VINQAFNRRAAVRLGAFGGLSASATAAAATTTVFDVTSYGAVGDGKTDDTTAIQKALDAAGAVAGSTVQFPPASGGCYRVTGVTVPGGVGTLVGHSELYSANAPTAASVKGSVLAPYSTSTTSLLTIGTSGSGSVVNTNPHGLVVDGLGFLGTVAAGTAISGFWGATVIDTSAVTFRGCRDLYCAAPAYEGYPTGASANGGFVRFLSSGTANYFSVNGRLEYCSSFGAGTFVLADGLSSTYPGGGSTDGQLTGCQVNGHTHGVQLGAALAGAGGWLVTDTHFSSAEGSSHVSYGLAGNAWTLRVENCYFDLCNGAHLVCHGRGLQAVGNYFRALTGTSAIYFGADLATYSRDPAAVLTGNVFDLNGSTTVTSFAHFAGLTSAEVAAHGGGEYRGNLVHNHGSAMPASWVGQYVGSNGTAVADTSTAHLDLVQGPVLSV
jgi:hypothetical protein